MRAPFLLLLLLLAPAAAAHDVGVPQPNSASVQQVTWAPEDPARGESVFVAAILKPGAQIDAVRLVHCRVQKYACAFAQTMEETPDGYVAEIKWDSRFFLREVREVGLNLTLERNGTVTERSPLDHWPGRPSELPSDGAYYYYYQLPEAKSQIPAPAAPWALLALLLPWAGVLPRRRP